MIHFKHQKDKDMFTGLHLALIMIYADLAFHTRVMFGIDLVITETITTKEEDMALNRQSDAHQKKIAIDIRANNISKDLVKKICNYINSKEEYKAFHYHSFSGQTRLAYDHGAGDNYHIHLQIHQKYAK